MSSHFTRNLDTNESLDYADSSEDDEQDNPRHGLEDFSDNNDSNDIYEEFVCSTKGPFERTRETP